MALFRIFQFIMLALVVLIVIVQAPLFIAEFYRIFASRESIVLGVLALYAGLMWVAHA